jgi:hypothetical protein
MEYLFPLSDGMSATAGRQATNGRSNERTPMSKRNVDHPATKLDSRVLAEETTTLPEGAILSIYCMSVGKLGHTSMKLVALHANMGRVEMSADKISPHNMRRYLELVRRDIARRRKLLTGKPELDRVKPDTMEDFILSMAYHDMFIFEALNSEPDQQNADNPTDATKVLQRRRKAKKLPQVLPDNNGTVQGSRTASGNSGRTKQ